MDIFPPDPLSSALSAETAAPSYIADCIGDAYQTWTQGRVLIDASCNTGKTSFILRNLLGWIKTRDDTWKRNHRILYLCNRVPLKLEVRLRTLTPAQMEQVLLDISTPESFSSGVASLCVLQTYQWLETYCLRNKEGLLHYLSSFHYIVADECHYFHCDALFNPLTDLSKQLLDQLASEKVIIYMSATAGLLFSQLSADRDHLIHHYHLQKPSSVGTLYSYARDAERNEILDCLPDGEKALVFVRSRKDLVEMKKRYGHSAGYYCSANNAGGAMDALEECIKDGALQKKILFCTTALYNGIDIKDPSLKHILLEIWDPIDMEQAFGRKRPVDAADTFALYLRSMSKQQLTAIRDEIEAKLLPADLYAQRNDSPENMKRWVAFCKDCQAREYIESILTEERDEENGTFIYHPKQMRMEKLLAQRQVLDAMIDQGYIPALLDSIPTISQKTCADYNLSELAQFLYQNLEESYPLEALKSSVIQAGHITVEGRSQNKPIGLTCINRFLKPYGFQIQRFRKWNKADRGAVYGRITFL